MASRSGGMHLDPAIKAARDKRNRERFKTRNRELQEQSKAKRRGVSVPPELEVEWLACKAKRMSNAEAAKFLGLKYRGKTKK